MTAMWMNGGRSMHNRSWLFVPGDSDTKLTKAVSTEADVIIVDLEASVPSDAKHRARELAAGWLRVHRNRILEQHDMGRWVRINALDSRLWRDDLVAVMPSAPDGIILPKASGPDALRQIAAEIYELEQRNQIAPGSTKLMPMAGETPVSALSIAAYADASQPRLAGLTWGAESLLAALSATRRREGKTGWTDVFRFIRAQVLLTAHAGGIMAIDAFHPDLDDEKGLKAATRDAKADGFSGMLAIHPEQVPAINKAFTPSEDELEQARQLVAAFETDPETEVLELDRRTIGEPNLKSARRVLGLDAVAVSEQPRAPILRPA